MDLLSGLDDVDGDDLALDVFVKVLLLRLKLIFLELFLLIMGL